MKFFQFSLFLFITACLSAQEINQFDESGKRHGVWKKNYDDTDVLRYEGEFFHGKEIGLFKFYKNVNKKPVLAATRQFHDEDDLAEVKFFSSKGKLISEGVMKSKTYIGTWKYYQKNSDTLLILEHYNDKGQLKGERFVYYPNGKVAEAQNYNNEQLDGPSTYYSDTGKISKTFFYVNGELHGMSKFYNLEGDLIIEGFYKNDKKHGIWKYYKDGKLEEEKDFTYSSNPKVKD
ncbi:toxin-antitoxin system YwqK family antitoxin [Changchengzhania lutea]|uniref:toxin-antitoxin system YwqK family antitoxin n=1 Tax=Changchengzhania lutea TaxID=2049305 RepID=UPI00115D9AED|nr:toxin-antitoxin system YwqK family antitoxin [Changchengzhania lutea]